MDILDDMGVSKLSANVFLKVNYSFKETHKHKHLLHTTAEENSQNYEKYSRFLPRFSSLL